MHLGKETIRIKAVFSGALGRINPGCIVDGVVWPVHERVLAEHGGHDVSASGADD
jgi:hypothetical protein